MKDEPSTGTASAGSAGKSVALTSLELPELRLVAQRYGAPSGRRWPATRDSANLDEPMTFIFRLFRSRQKSLELVDPPFQYEQRLAIAGDQPPGGAL